MTLLDIWIGIPRVSHPAAHKEASFFSDSRVFGDSEISLSWVFAELSTVHLTFERSNAPVPRRRSGPRRHSGRKFTGDKRPLE